MVRRTGSNGVRRDVRLESRHGLKTGPSDLHRVAGPGMLLALAVAAQAIALLIRPMEEVSNRAFLGIFFISCTAVILLAAGLISLEMRTRAQRRAVARIGSRLGEISGRGSLAAALREAVRDPGLEVAYWLPGSNRYVDANGNPVPQPVASPGRTVTAVVRSGQRIAVVSHTAALSELERHIGAAVRLGWRTRLQAEVLARLEEIRASRARIVETGDAERRRIERDLHDGVQQRLIALSYDIRLAHTQADADGDAAPQRCLRELWAKRTRRSASSASSPTGSTPRSSAKQALDLRWPRLPTRLRCLSRSSPISSWRATPSLSRPLPTSRRSRLWTTLSAGMLDTLPSASSKQREVSASLTRTAEGAAILRWLTRRTALERLVEP